MGMLKSDTVELDLQSSYSLPSFHEMDSLNDEQPNKKTILKTRCKKWCREFSIIYVDCGIYFYGSRKYVPIWAMIISVLVLMYLSINFIYLCLPIGSSYVTH